MSEARILIKGNLTADPELRFTQSGVAVAGFSIAVNHRKKDANNQWVDDGVSFYRCTAWRQLAENICEHFTRGMYVMVEGSTRERTWVDSEGYERKTMETTVFEAGIAMTLAPKPPSPPEPQWEQEPEEVYEDGTYEEEAPAPPPPPRRAAPAKKVAAKQVAAKKTAQAAKRAPARTPQKRAPQQGPPPGYSDEPPF